MRAVALVLCLGACSQGESSPEQTMSAFFAAVASGRAGEVYGLLAPASQQTLQKMAERATAQAGGGHRFRAEELLAVSLARSRYQPKQVTLLHAEGDRAQVRVAGEGAQAFEVFDLVRTEGRWRVLLPERASSFALD